jgi:aryl sulfotransferase
MHHLRTVWERRHERNVALFHYSDLRRDLDGEMRRLAATLGINVDESVWPALLNAASLDAMRAKADVLAPNTSHDLWRDNRAFFAEGRLGAWRDVFDDSNCARYERRVTELVGDDPDFVAWLHR